MHVTTFVRLAAAAVLLPLVLAAQPRPGGPGTPGSSRPLVGTLRVTTDRLEATFPAMALADAGCAAAPSGRIGAAPRRWYMWHVENYSARRRMGEPYVTISASFSLPASTRLTNRRVDSVFASLPVTLDYLVGEPPQPRERRPLARGALQWSAKGVRLIVLDSVAIQAFLAPGRTHLRLSWCQGHGASESIPVAITP